MSTRTEQLQALWHHYERQNGNRPSSARQAVEWAVRDGRLALPKIDAFDILAGQMASALREEYETDGSGRRYRVNHALRVTKGGVQYCLWADMRQAPHDYMKRAFGQRRDQILNDCLQLKTDVDVYNGRYRGNNTAIQLKLDFTNDMAERQAVQALTSSIGLRKPA